MLQRDQGEPTCVAGIAVLFGTICLFNGATFRTTGFVASGALEGSIRGLRTTGLEAQGPVCLGSVGQLAHVLSGRFINVAAE